MRNIKCIYLATDIISVQQRKSLFASWHGSLNNFECTEVWDSLLWFVEYFAWLAYLINDFVWQWRHGVEQSSRVWFWIFTLCCRCAWEKWRKLRRWLVAGSWRYACRGTVPSCSYGYLRDEVKTVPSLALRDHLIIWRSWQCVTFIVLTGRILSLKYHSYLSPVFNAWRNCLWQNCGDINEGKLSPRRKGA